MTISDLTAAPHFFDAVADRIWRQWHFSRGVSLDELRGRLAENLTGAALPKAFVAHDGATFLGTISLIASDLDERPDLTPWVAALWVEPSARRAGVGARLLDLATSVALTGSGKTLYLCAQEGVSAYYLEKGWRLLETGVGPRHLSVLCRTST